MSSLLTTSKTKSEQGFPSRETSEIVTFSVSRKHGSIGMCCRNRFSHWASPSIAPTEIKHISGKRKGGGAYFMINDSWCNHNNIKELKSFCSTDLKFHTIKCRPFHLPREFLSVIVTAVADCTSIEESQRYATFQESQEPIHAGSQESKG